MSFDPTRPVVAPTMITNNEVAPAPLWAEDAIIPAYGYELTARFEGTVYTSRQTGNDYMLVRVYIHEALTKPGQAPIGFKCDRCFNPKVDPQVAITTATEYVVNKLHNSNRVNLYQLGQVGAKLVNGWPVLYISHTSELNTKAKVGQIAGVRVYAKVCGEYTWLNYHWLIKQDPNVFTGPDAYQAGDLQNLTTGFAHTGQLYSMDFLAHRENVMEEAMQTALNLLAQATAKTKAKATALPLIYS